MPRVPPPSSEGKEEKKASQEKKASGRRGVIKYKRLPAHVVRYKTTVRRSKTRTSRMASSNKARTKRNKAQTGGLRRRLQEAESKRDRRSHRERGLATRAKIICQNVISLANVRSLRAFFQQYFPKDPVFLSEPTKRRLCARLEQLLKSGPLKTSLLKRFAELDSIAGLEKLMGQSAIDPYTLTLMNNPYITTSGYSMDKSTLAKAFGNSDEFKDRVHNVMLHKRDNRPNRSLRAKIREDLILHAGIDPKADFGPRRRKPESKAGYRKYLHKIGPNHPLLARYPDLPMPVTSLAQEHAFVHNIDVAVLTYAWGEHFSTAHEEFEAALFSKPIEDRLMDERAKWIELYFGLDTPTPEHGHRFVGWIPGLDHVGFACWSAPTLKDAVLYTKACRPITVNGWHRDEHESLEVIARLLPKTMYVLTNKHNMDALIKGEEPHANYDDDEAFW